MAKVEFGERCGEYIQEIEMQELVIKCDICLLPIKEKNEVNLQGKFLTEDGRMEIIALKDICSDCSKMLHADLGRFVQKRRQGRGEQHA